MAQTVAHLPQVRLAGSYKLSPGRSARHRCRTCGALRVIYALPFRIETASASAGGNAKGLRTDVATSATHPMPNASATAGILLAASALLLVSAAPLPAQARLELPNREADDTSSPLVQELLKRSAENREKYNKERLQEYYRRNFKEYFEFEAASPRVAQARGLSAASQQAIAKWLQENK